MTGPCPLAKAPPKGHPMYETLILDYLTHYQPELKAAMEQEGSLLAYLRQQADAMQAARERIITELAAREPGISALQRAMEADQQVRAMFLPLD